ncbi:MAG TPA: FapA family protein, partial [Candidatus Hydrogenedentes bacterium]|nr:FapA family protein [Candidatus Hydrogenedentota bacterium]
AGSRVEAKGDIEVRGYIEDAHVEAGGSLTVHGGITGGAGSLLRIAGAVHAKFILNATVEAMGDVVVEREINNAVVRTRGAVKVPHGRIVAGEIQALSGIDTAHAGSDAGIPTLLASGEDYTLPARIQAKETELAALRGTLHKVHARLDPLTGQEHRLSAQSRQTLAVLHQKLCEAEQKSHGIEAQMREMREGSRKRAVNRIVVRTCVHPDASFRVAQRGLYARETVPGPVAILIREGEVGFFATTPPR